MDDNSFAKLLESRTHYTMRLHPYLRLLKLTLVMALLAIIAEGQTWWHSAKVAVATLDGGTSAEVERVSQVGCAQTAADTPWAELFCYEDDQCFLSDVKVASSHDDSSIGPVASCWTKHGEMCCCVPFFKVSDVGCFLTITSPKNWLEAREYCRTNGADLADPSDYNAFELALRDRSFTQQAWIGVKSRVWLSGRSVTEWHPREPDGAFDDCGRILINDGKYVVADRGCSNTFAFVCEKKFP